MDKYILSKSSFIRGLQCHKSLYLYKKFPYLRDKMSSEQQAKFSRGTKVGELARKLFPGGKNVSRICRNKTSEMIAKTAELIAKGEKVIYEAAFQFDRVLVILDILVKRDDEWYAYEVKSSLKITETYELDTSIQYYVITKSGLKLKDISLILINSSYVRSKELELEKLFVKTSMLSMALFNEPLVSFKIKELKQVLEQASVPKVDIGIHCHKPYLCEFKGHCWKHIPASSVFEIEGMNEDRKFSLYYNGFVSLTSVPQASLENFHQRIQLEGALSSKEVVLKDQLNAFFSKMTYPRIYLHIETISPAVPLFNWSSPYEQIPFALAGLVKANKTALAEYFFLVPSVAGDPREEFINSFLEATSGAGCIVIYDLLYCSGLLYKLSLLFPDKKEAINDRLTRMIGLSEPIREKFFYLPAFKGRSDIDTVLQVVPSEQNQSFYERRELANALYLSMYEQMDMFKSQSITSGLQALIREEVYLLEKLTEKIENSA